MSRNNLPATVELRPDSCLGFFKWLTVAGRRPDGPCHGRAEELTREGTEGIGRCAIVLIMARCTSGQRNAPLTGMHVSCTNRDRPCSLCHNPVSTATKTSALPILSVKNINTQIPHARSRFSRFSRTRTKNATGSTYKRDNRVFCAGACGSVRDAIIA